MSRLFAIFCILLVLGCALTKDTKSKSGASPHVLIFNDYSENFDAFRHEVDSLKVLSERFSKEKNTQELKDQLTRTRLAFKRIEFLFDYLEPTFSYLYINGGPLPKLHKEVAEVDIIPPNGLQRLDELIFSDELSENIQELAALTDQLSERVAFIEKSHFYDTISPQNAIEALRSGLVRVFTLGLTGFDTPGSGNGVAESQKSMESMAEAFSKYEHGLSSDHRKSFKLIENRYEQGIDMLRKNPNFESVDRLSFLKEVINPLYRDLFTFQKSLEIENTFLNRHAQNYNALNLFDEDFVDRNYFTQFTYGDVNNKEAIKLGKTLFYDPILSRKMDMSCASCHHPDKGFTDGLSKSIGNATGVFTKRNSPTLIDAGYSSKYFWDMREHDLENQVAHVVEDSLEFNIGFREIAKRLNQSAEYVEMFDAAYKDFSKNDINRRSISNAIAAYVNTLTSFNSSFDQYVRGDTDVYSQSAKAGFNLFMGKAACGTCHFAPVFNGSVPPFYIEAESEVLGVTEGYDIENPILDKDLGRSRNGRGGDAHPHFDHSFKTVTVRNAQLTAPYMHNGSFETLEDVINFYNDGGGAGMGVEIDNQTLASDSLHLSALEKSQLIDFLHTLTDTSGLDPGKIILPTFEGQPYWNQRGRPKVIDD